MDNTVLAKAIEALKELQDDVAVPRNVKSKIVSIVSVLESAGEASIKIDKALQQLDEISDDVNMQPFTRTQLWNIASILESVSE